MTGKFSTYTTVLYDSIQQTISDKKKYKSAFFIA